MSIYDEYDMTIGIECHVQLATKTKLFSAANNDSRVAEPNSNVSPVDYGLPGMLPVLNKEAVTLAIRAAKALDSDVALESNFDRKHYFYPDLPKGYQTTQMYQPIIGAGVVTVPLEDGSTVDVRIHHAHMEEDAGKLVHYGDRSLVDLNRAGTPLIEIVTEPDIHSAEAARAFATELYRRMTYAGVTHGDLYHGNMRFDVNISVAKKGATELGNRAEVKNLNSFRSVERAAEYEFRRQVDLLENGERVVQETRGWNDDKQITTSQRSKEDAQDYRYMPDPDIPPIKLTSEQIERIQNAVPKLPPQYRESWAPIELDGSVMNTLLSHRPVMELIDAVYTMNENQIEYMRSEYSMELESKDIVPIVRRIANWFASTPDDMISIENIESGLVGPRRIILLGLLAHKGLVSSTNAKEIFVHLFEEKYASLTPQEIAQKNNLLQNSDADAVASIVDEVLADPASQKAIDDIKGGNQKAIGYLVGQVMKQSKGKANPAMATKIINSKLQ